jgi:23S rRNA pseudouridine955/2504/2580 synthase/23S rRNA pseudouridine1911/1915/1917 synthase
LQQTIHNSFVIEAREAGQRLDLVLARRYPQLNRGDWQKRIREGAVKINDSVSRPSRRVTAGDRIGYTFQRNPEPEITRTYQIVYEDEYLYVIDKPGDLPVHPSGVYNKNTLYSLLKAERGEDFPVRLVHRLDRETSGLMLIAKDRSTAAALQRAIQQKADEDDENGVQKIYQVIVESPRSFPEFLDARGWIFAAGTGVVRKKRSFAFERPSTTGELPTNSLQSAHTRFYRIAERTGMALVRARLYTGRMHQIRATLHSLGYPVVGDRMYGVDEQMYLRMIEDRETPADRERLRINRTALHACELILRHPRSGERLHLRSELPADMRRLFFEHEDQADV